MKEYDAALNVCPYCGYKKGTAEKSKNHLSPGTVLIDRYLIGRCLGQGGFGITYIAWDQRLYQKVAIKEFMPTSLASRLTGRMEITCYNDEAQERFQNGIRRMLDESRRLAQFNELESVVKVYDCFEANQTAYIIMEYLDGENIKDILEENGPFSYAETVKIMLPVLRALRDIHATGLIHRDISPDNIFLCHNGKVKLLDFGSARVASGEDEKSLSIILKPGYAPQEQYSSSASQSAGTDVYAVCATAYKMLTGLTPIDSLERRVQADKLEPINELVSIPADAAQAIMQGLAIDVADRLRTVEPLLEIFSRDSGEEIPPVVKLKKKAKRKLSAQTKKNDPVRRIAITCAAVLLAAAMGLVVYKVGEDAGWWQHKPDPVTATATTTTTKPTVTAARAELTPYQKEMLQEAEQKLPTQSVPAFGERESIKKEYADSLSYTADEGNLFAEYRNADGELLLREQISSSPSASTPDAAEQKDKKVSPISVIDACTLYAYEDGRQTAEVRYAPDGSIERAERFFYNKADGALFAHAVYKGAEWESVQVIPEYNHEHPVAGFIQYAHGPEENVTYTDNDTALVEKRFNTAGREIYSKTQNKLLNKVEEIKKDEGGNEESRTVRQYDTEKAELCRECVEYSYNSQIRKQRWEYDEKSGQLLKHTVLDASDAQTGALLFAYDKKGKLTSVGSQTKQNAPEWKVDLGSGHFYLYTGDENRHSQREYTEKGEQVGSVVTDFYVNGSLSGREVFSKDGKTMKRAETYKHNEKSNTDLLVCAKAYDGGELTERTEYEYDENGALTQKTQTKADGGEWTETVSDADGSDVRIRVFDQRGTIQSLTVYDANGAVTEKYHRERRALVNDQVFQDIPKRLAPLSAGDLPKAWTNLNISDLDR